MICAAYFGRQIEQMLNYEKDTYNTQILSQQFEEGHGNDINMRDYQFLPSIQLEIQGKDKGINERYKELSRTSKSNKYLTNKEELKKYIEIVTRVRHRQNGVNLNYVSSYR